MKSSNRLETKRISCKAHIAVWDEKGTRLQTRTRRTLWDKMHLAKVIERPIREWYKVEW